MEIYRIYTLVNAADTMRDPDDIHETELAYKDDRKKAKKFIEEYIKEKFSKPDEAKIYEDESGFRATNFISYGQTIIAKKVIVE